MHAACRYAIPLLAVMLYGLSAPKPQASPADSAETAVHEPAPTGSRDFPTAATIVETRGALSIGGETSGNVRVTFADGHTEMWTERGRCTKPRVVNGSVGWVCVTSANGQGEPIKSVVRVRALEGKVRDFPAARFIKDWNFAGDGYRVVIKSSDGQGPSGCVLFDSETGKQLHSVKSTAVRRAELFTALPGYAQPFADAQPPPVGTEAHAAGKARVMIEGFRRGALARNSIYDEVQEFPVIGGGPVIPVEPLSDVVSMADVGPSGAELAKLGVAVFPQVFALLDDEQTYMRYIGVVALNNLTGLEPLWYYFWWPWDEGGQPAPWAAQAKAEWLGWYTRKLADSVEKRSAK